MALPPVELRGIRVLVVDDNATNREILHTRLTFWGMLVDEADSGEEALLCLKNALDEKEPYQIAVLDMQMPNMDGETLGKIIRNNPELKDLRLILLTSLGIRGDASRFAAIGFNAYLTKPFRHIEFKTILSHILSDASTDTSLPYTITTRHTAREIHNRFAAYKARILLAEDNITNQQVALGILKKMGLTADAVANGLEAINALKNIPYDLVFMDVQMPEMDGLEATRRIRNMDNSIHEIPIIAMTAHAMASDRKKCLETGMNDYIAKPISPDAIADALEKWLPQNIIELPDNSQANENVVPTPDSTSNTQDSPPVWNHSVFMDRVMGDKTLATIVLETFLNDIPNQIDTLIQHINNNDIQAVTRCAHTIKGAAANVGGECLQQVALKIETAGKNNTFSQIRELLPELENSNGNLSTALHKYLNS